MKIAITGSVGLVGKDVVRYCAKQGHHTVQINLNDEEDNETPNTTMKAVNVATDYDGFLEALRGCDALIHLAATPNPTGKRDCDVHANNVNSSFNAFRACGELSIHRVCWASSANAIGLAYSNQPRPFPYFPIDEAYPYHTTDSYALSKHEGEIQAAAFVKWYPGMKIACLRIHEVNTLAFVRAKHARNFEGGAVPELFGWVNPEATARACLLSVMECEKWEGCEIFNIHAPTTTQTTASRELARKYYPDTEIRGGMEGNAAFWSIEKAEKNLGWTHPETE